MQRLYWSSLSPPEWGLQEGNETGQTVGKSMEKTGHPIWDVLTGPMGTGKVVGLKPSCQYLSKRKTVGGPLENVSLEWGWGWVKAFELAQIPQIKEGRYLGVGGWWWRQFAHSMLKTPHAITVRKTVLNGDVRAKERTLKPTSQLSKKTHALFLPTLRDDPKFGGARNRPHHFSTF